MAKLGEVCLLKAGKFVSANDISPEYNKGLYPCFGGNGIRGYVADYTHDGEFPLIGRQGALCGNVNLASGKFHATEHAVVVQPKAEMNVHWLYYALNAMNLGQYATGAAQPGLAVSKLETLSIEIPNISEQNKIAQTLYKVEQLVNFRKQQLAKLDELVKARFVEMFGNPKDNKKRWNRVPLKKVAEVRGRVGWKGYKKEDLQESGPLVLGATHLTENGNIDLSSPVYLSRDKYEESPEIMLHRNDLVFTQRGNTIGKVGLVKEDIGEATINPCVLILRPTNIHPIYLDVYFIMDEVKKDMWRLNAGSAQPMITQKGISEYLLMLPPIELQNQFAAFVERVDKQKQTVQQSLEKLELMKKALMQEYFG